MAQKEFKEIYRLQFDKNTLAVAALEDGSFSFAMAKRGHVRDLAHIQFAISEAEAKELASAILNSCTQPPPPSTA